MKVMACSRNLKGTESIAHLHAADRKKIYRIQGILAIYVDRQVEWQLILDAPTKSLAWAVEHGRIDGSRADIRIDGVKAFEATFCLWISDEGERVVLQRRMQAMEPQRNGEPVNPVRLFQEIFSREPIWKPIEYEVESVDDEQDVDERHEISFYGDPYVDDECIVAEHPDREYGS